MSTLTATQLQQQYIAYFGRPGDPEGINYWTSDATDIKTAADFAEKIYAQSEYQTTTLASKTTTEQVNQLYVNLFNRSADAEGLLYWTTEIEKGSLSLSNLAYDLIYATQNPLEDNGQQAAQDAANLNAKVAAAEAYTTTVASNAGALIAYQPGPAYESAVSFISSVSFNTQVNQPVITTASGLAPLNTQAVNTFVAQMIGA
jgi:lipopolysaccharide transport system ATP-binding protein